MLDVFFTVDVEIWCNDWKELDKRFPIAFQQYIYGSTSKGDYGLPYQLDVLNSHGLTGVFFVEPLFSTRFGSEYLTEVVELIQEKNQDVELHLHTEWVDEARAPLLDNIVHKRQHLRDFSFQEQSTLVGLGAKLLKQAGVADISAFRAGNFAFNRDTLRALSANGIRYDSSYNACHFGLDSGVMMGTAAVEPFECENVYEYPMMVFDDGSRSLRHAQLTACTYEELEGLLWQALEMQRKSFVILFHNYELLNRVGSRPDHIVIKRFRKLCAFLEKNSDCFNVRGFHDLSPSLLTQQPEPCSSPIWRTGVRMLEQVYRRRYG